MPQTTPNGFSVPQVNYNILSTLQLLNDRNFSALVKDYPELGIADSYIMKMEMSGASKYTPTKKWRQWRDANRAGKSFKLVAAAAGAAGVAVTGTLLATSHVGGGLLSPVSIGQIYEDDLNRIQYEVRAVNKSVSGAHTVTLAPTKASQSAAITTASLLCLVGRNSIKDGSVQEDGVYADYTNVQKDLQGIRTNKEFSDLAAFEKLEVNGQSFMSISRTGMEAEHITTQEETFMKGDFKDNLTAVGNANTAAKGVIPTILAEGIDMTASTVLNDAYFKTIARATAANGYSSSYDVLHGVEYGIKYQDYLRTAQPATTRVELNVSDKEIDAIFDFSGRVKIYGVDINLKPYKYFNSQLMYGADVSTGFYNDAAVFIPTGTHYNEAASGNLPYLRVRYMSETEGGERTKMLTDGGLFGKSTEMNGEIALVSWKGIEMYAPKAFIFSKLS